MIKNIDKSKITFRYAGHIYNSLVNGEGIRDVIFFAGCDKRCKGCHNAHIQPMDSGELRTVDEVIDPVINHLQAGMIDGVTLSGGDPVCQKYALIDMAKKLKEHGANIWLYTGELFETLDMDILGYIDTVVDGPFDETKTPGGKYSGSSNQRVFVMDKDKGVFVRIE